MKLTSPTKSRRRRLCATWRQPAPEPLEPRIVLAADPMISEFQAVNATTIADDDGEFSDWIELRNPGTEALDVGGWYLTDDANELKKWQIPSTSIDPSEQIVIFASGKNRRVASQLHTNFRLSGNGEYLALVKPDGLTVAQDFGDQYPALQEDQSYGLVFARESVSLLDHSAAVSAFVPTDESLGSEWTQLSFDDSAWTAGAGAVGFENLRAGFTESLTTPLGPEWTIDLPEGAASTVEVVEDGIRMVLPEDQDTSYDDRGLAPIVYRDLPGDNLTDWEVIVEIQRDDIAERGRVGLVIYDEATGKPALRVEQTGRNGFDFRAGNVATFERLTVNHEGSFFMRVVHDGVAKSWETYVKVEADDRWRSLHAVTEGIGGIPAIADPKPGVFGRTPRGAAGVVFKQFEINVADERESYSSQIGLDVGDAMWAVNSSVYVRIPFQVEGAPNQFDVLNLGARFDDGFKAYLNGTEIAAENIPINVTWESTAAGVHGAVFDHIPLQRIETDASSLREGDNVLAIHGMNVAADDNDFYLDTTLTTSRLLSLSERFFADPSPGATNLVPNAPAPVLNSVDGVFFGSQTIELAVEDVAPTLEVRYTLDGTQPTQESELYTGPFAIEESAMLQARTFDTLPLPNFEPSNITNGTFFILDEELRERTSDMPLMIVDTLGQGIPGDSSNDLRESNVVLFDVHRATGRSALEGGIVDYLGRGGVRDRGSSTAGQPKPNMTFETWGPDGSTPDDDFDASLLGLPADSDWVLHAPFNFDRALMRNQLSYELSNQMGMWASHSRFVEVYLNRRGEVNERDYAGVYVLQEKIRQGPHRVDIAELGPDHTQEPEVSGGYIWKVDRPDPDAPGFTAGEQAMNWVYPKSPLSTTARPEQMATPEQEAWATAYIDAFNATLEEPDINDPEGYTKYIEVNSWIDQHLINTMMWNVDAFVLSAFFHKDRDGKLAYGPLWDFDRAAGSPDGRDDSPFLWRNFFTNQRWFTRLFRDPGFWQLYVDRWQMWRRTVLSDENISMLIDQYADEARESAERNFAKWSQIAPRSSPSGQYESGKLDGSYQGEVEHLRKWMLDRTKFMDGNFTGPPEFLINDSVLGRDKGFEVTSGQEVEIVSAPIETFEDTAIVSGEPGEAVGRYFVPANNDLGDSWTQTDFDDSSWASGPTGIGFDSAENFTELIKTEANVQNVQDATNILVRIPFEADPAAIADQTLVLRMKIDDGYVAYLNGTEVARVGLDPDEIGWDSRAGNRPTRKSVEWDDRDISEFSNVLVEGTNMLAIRGVNTRSSSGDMLILPALVTREFGFTRSPDAKVYYTVDGTDPLGIDGNPSPTAKLAMAGDKLAILENTRVIARNFHESEREREAAAVLTQWSGPVQYDFVTTKPTISVTEINYNPARPTASELTSIPDADGNGEPDWTNKAFEFIEVHNPGPADASLVGVELSDGVEFDFTNASNTTLAAGSYGIVVANTEAFQLRYGGGHPVLGQFDGNLNNNGEDIDLISGTGEILSSVRYGDNDPWPVRADGVGATLELIDPKTSLASQSKYYSWRASSSMHGTPGMPGEAPIGVVINEVIAHTEAPVRLADSIELFNGTGAAIDIGGWYLSDSANEPLKFQIPAGTTLGPGAYVVYDERHFNAQGRGFALSGDRGDDVWLTMADDNGAVQTFVDDVRFRASQNGESLARIPNGSGRLSPAVQPTFGSENAAPRVGPIVISEFNFNPGPPREDALTIDPTLSAGDLEFVEILNPTTTAVELSDWNLRGGVDYNFDAGLIAAGEALVIVKFNPENPENINRLNGFRAHYGIGADVRIVGGYGGQLNNSDDRIVLLRPVAPPTDRPNFIPRVQEDEVLYDDQAPWPTGADGTGNSLQRRTPTHFGNDGRSWFAGLPTPGSQSADLPGDFDASGVVDAIDIDLLSQQIESATPDVAFDLTSDGSVDAADRDFLVRDILGTNYGDSNLDGIFNSSDMVAIFVVGEYEDGIDGNSTWAEGDWDGDSDFDSADLVLAFRSGGFSAAAMPSRLVDLTIESLFALSDGESWLMRLL